MNRNKKAALLKMRTFIPFLMRTLESSPMQVELHCVKEESTRTFSLDLFRIVTYAPLALVNHLLLNSRSIKALPQCRRNWP